jgi:uncharacterized protein YkuJ
VRFVTLLAAVAILTPAAALARPLEVYVARLSAADHFNSNGARLGTVAAVIRQDRANFHRFDIRDPEDEDDSFFDSADNRARLEALIARGTVTGRARRAILNGTPLIVVKVWNDYIEVDVR